MKTSDTPETDAFVSQWADSCNYERALAEATALLKKMERKIRALIALAQSSDLPE